MMTVICGREPEYLLNTSRHLFKLESKQDWFNDSLVEEMVLDVDKTEHIRGAVFDSPVLGAITADQLSGGVKGLILILKSNKLKSYHAMRSSIFGDNCVKWLIKLSHICDFTIYMSHYLDFYFGGDYSQGFDGYRNTPIDAVGENGEVLTTCGDVMKYFEDNDISECHFTSVDREVQELKVRQAIDRYKDPEYFAKMKKMHPYIVSIDHPFSVAYMNLSNQLQIAKSNEEASVILDKMHDLCDAYLKGNI